MVVVGQHQHYHRIRPGNGLGNGLSAGGRSRQWALVFSQKIIAVILPALSAVNKEPEIIALTSATPRSSSTRKRLRSVLGAQPTILAISAPEGPTVRRLSAGGNRIRTIGPALVKGLSAVADERCRTDKLDGVIKHRSSRETTMVGRGASLDGRLFLGGTDRRYGAGGEEWQLRRCIFSMECRDAPAE